jgi:hypothetical protein
MHYFTILNPCKYRCMEGNDCTVCAAACSMALWMCGCKCVTEGKGVVNSWHQGLSLRLSLRPTEKDLTKSLKLEDRHDITHDLMCTISSIIN